MLLGTVFFCQKSANPSVRFFEAKKSTEKSKDSPQNAFFQRKNIFAYHKSGRKKTCWNELIQNYLSPCDLPDLPGEEVIFLKQGGSQASQLHCLASKGAMRRRFGKQLAVTADRGVGVFSRTLQSCRKGPNGRGGVEM